MKSILKFLILVGIVSSLSSCVAIVPLKPGHAHLPPGHAKKITGSQSAKAYAPGQRKKH